MPLIFPYNLKLELYRQFGIVIRISLDTLQEKKIVSKLYEYIILHNHNEHDIK